MKISKRIIGMGLILMMLSGTVAGCSANNAGTETNQSTETTTTEDTSSTTGTEATTESQEIDSTESTIAMTEGELTVVTTDLASDSSYDESTAVNIEVSERGFSIDGEGASAVGNVLTITTGGTYVVSGATEDGNIIIDSEEEVQLVLNNVSITSTENSAIYVKNAELTTITVAAGTQNTISDAENYVFEYATEEEPDGAIFSKDDLVINGTGTLTINGNYSHAVKAKDQLLITELTLVVTSLEDAINASEELVIASGNYTITAGDDAIHSDLALSIDGGVVNIISSEEGIEASAIAITGGDITVNSNDDALNAASDEATVNSISISGGTLRVNASGDGLDANGFIVMTSGEVIVNGPTNDGNGFMDYDSSFTLTGGTLLAAGTSGMAQSISDTSEQAALLVVFDQIQSVGTIVMLTNSEGDVIAEVTPEKEFSALLISTPEVKQGETYTVLASGVELCTVTLDTVATAIKSDGTATTVGMMGGRMGGGMRQEFEEGEMPSGDMPSGDMPVGGMQKGERPSDMNQDTTDSLDTTN